MSGNAMYAAVTGASAQQARIELLSHNIANLNTTGFKSVRGQFEDLFYQTVRPPAAEGDSPTGLQFGRGSRIVSTDRDFTVGPLRQTGNALDWAIDGRGFLGVQTLAGDIAYTRDGALRVDANGNVVNSAGLLLDPPITIPADALEIQVTRDGIVNVRQPGSSGALTQVGQIQLSTFPNEGGLIALGSNLYQESEGSGAPTTSIPGTQGVGEIAQGSLEESNVNIAEELVDLILAQRAFEANTRVISASDDILRFVTQR